MMGKVFWTLCLYAFSILCIDLFFYLGNCKEIADWLQEIDSNNTTFGFRLYIYIGLIKLVSILLGVTLFIMLTIRLVKSHSR